MCYLGVKTQGFWVQMDYLPLAPIVRFAADRCEGKGCSIL